MVSGSVHVRTEPVPAPEEPLHCFLPTFLSCSSADLLKGHKNIENPTPYNCKRNAKHLKYGNNSINQAPAGTRRILEVTDCHNCQLRFDSRTGRALVDSGPDASFALFDRTFRQCPLPLPALLCASRANPCTEPSAPPIPLPAISTH